MGHETEAVALVLKHSTYLLLPSYFVILSSIDRGSKIKVGSTTLLKSAPGRNWEIMCDRTVFSIRTNSTIPILAVGF